MKQTKGIKHKMEKMKKIVRRSRTVKLVRIPNQKKRKLKRTRNSLILVKKEKAILGRRK